LHIQQRIFDFKAKISKFLLKVATTIMNGHQRFLPGKLQTYRLRKEKKICKKKNPTKAFNL
jgi:hypothetical protein